MADPIKNITLDIKALEKALASAKKEMAEQIKVNKAIASAAQKVSQELGITEKSARNLVLEWKRVAEEQERVRQSGSNLEKFVLSMGTSMGKTGKELEKFRENANKVAQGLQKTAAAAMATGNILKTTLTTGMPTAFLGKLLEGTAKYNKSLYDLKATARITGQDFSELEKSISNISTATGFSSQGAADFTRTLQRGMQGTKLATTATEALAVAMTDAFGSSIEDVKEPLNDLLEVQKISPDIMQRMADGMSTGEIRAFATELQSVHHVNEKVIESFYRTAEAAGKDKPVLDAKAQAYKNLSDGIAKLKAKGEELMLQFGAPMIEMFKGIMEWAQKALSWIMKIVKENPKLAAFAGKAMAFGAIGLPAAKLAGGAAMSMGGSAILGKLTGGLLGKRGDSPGSPMYTKDVMAATSSGGALGGIAAKLGLLYAATAAVSAVITGASAELSAENDAQLAKMGTFDSILHMVNPVNLGAAIGAAIRGEWEPAPEVREGSSGLNPDAVAAHQKFKAEGGRNNPEWKKEREAAVQAQQEAAKAKAAAKEQEAAAAATAESFEKQRASLAVIVTQHQKITEFGQKNIASLNAQAEFALKYKDDLGGAQAMYQKIGVEIQDQITAQEQTLAATRQLKALGSGSYNEEQRRAALKKSGASDAVIETTILADRKALASDEMQIIQKISELQAEKLNNIMKEADAIEVRRGLIEGELQLAESQLSLSKGLYMGLGPTIDAQNKILDVLEKQITSIDMQIEMYKKIKSDQPGFIEAQKKLFDLQTQRTNAVTKELEITKGLREGYLDAMGAFSNVSGAFSKIITKQDQGMGFMIQRFKAASSLKLGGAGGLDTPFANISPQGQLDMAPREQLDKFMEERAPHLKDAISRSTGRRASASSVLGDMSESQRDAILSGSGKSGITTGKEMTPKAAGAPGVTGGAGAPGATGTPDTTGAAGAGGKIGVETGEVRLIDVLPDKIAEGINKSKLMEIGLGKGTTGAAGAGKGTAGTAGAVQTEEGKKIEEITKKIEQQKEQLKIVSTAAAGRANAENKEATEKSKKRIEATIASLEAQKAELQEKEKNKAEEAAAPTAAPTPATPATPTVPDAVEKERKKAEAQKAALEQQQAVEKAVEEKKSAAQAEQLEKERIEEEKRANWQANMKSVGGVGAADKAVQKQTEQARKYTAEQGKSTGSAIAKEMAKTAQSSGGPTKAWGYQGSVTPEMEAIKKRIKEVKAKEDSAWNMKKDISHYEKTGKGRRPNKEEQEEADSYTRHVSGRIGLEQQLQNEQKKMKGIHYDVGGGKTERFNKEEADAKSGMKEVGGIKSEDATWALIKQNEDQFKQDVEKNNKLGKSLEGVSDSANKLEGTISNKVATAGTTELGEPPMPSATGGFVPGIGDKDSVPAMLMPGEFVMNKEQSRKYGWLLASLNKNKYASGGVVGGALGPSGPPPDSGGGGGFSPKFAINIKGDSVDKITRAAMGQLKSQLNKMMTPSGTTGRMFDLGNS